MAVFEYLRLSLSVPVIGALDTTGSRQEPTLSRQEYLRSIFSERHDFFFRKSLFSFVPAASDALPENILAGFVGRQVSLLESGGPENLFALMPQKKWKAAFLAVDIGAEKQIVAMERRTEVGASHSILEHLIDSQLKNHTLSWHTDIEYVTETASFVSAAYLNRGSITELTFVFNPPNGLRGFDRFKEFDRLAKQQTNSEKSEYSLKNKQGGVDPTGEFVESAVEYASEGAGQIKMKNGNKVIYDSRSAKVVRDVPESLMPREGEPTKIAGTSSYLLSSKKGKDRD